MSGRSDRVGAGLCSALGALVSLLLAVGGLVLVASPAHASIRTVVLDETGPSPRDITIGKGDVVRFFNNGNSTHTITRVAGNWAFKADIKAGQAGTTKEFTSPGTFTYRDSFTLVAIPREVEGTIVVPASKPTASPTASPKPGTKPGPSPSATRSPAARPAASPQPGATTAPQPVRSGTAVLPGIGVGGLPIPTPTQTAGPQPNIAPPVAAGAPSTPAAIVAYGDPCGVCQDSPHRYGLPAALALVGIVGVLSLLVRLLLAEPAARQRRTRTGAGPVVTLEG